MLNVENLSFGIEGKTLLYATSINFERGLFHVIMGANGAGKSTLLKLLAGDLQPLSGSVLLQGRPLTAYTKKELAQSRAVLSQQYHLAFPVSVQEVVLMGRYPYFGAAPTATDKAICNMSMAQMDVLHLAGRDYGTLSGGEAQKVQMSRVLAQIGDKDFEAKLLLLDEPVSHLDVKYQHQLLKAAKNLCNRGVTVVAVLHDINLAITYANRVLFMKEGRMVHDLADTRSISTDIIQAVFDVSATILLQNEQKPVVVF